MYKLQTRRQGWFLPLMLVSAGLVSGCSGNEEDARTPPSDTAAEAPAEQPVAPVQDVEPLVVSISAGAAMRDDRRLSITGRTNLPDDAQLLVVVERETSGTRWHERTQAENGQFKAGPMGFGSGVPDGDYRIRVQLAEASVQPAAVRKRIGAKGEGLEGELVTQAPHGLGRIAVYTREFSIGSELSHLQERGDEVHYPQN